MRSVSFSVVSVPPALINTRNIVFIDPSLSINKDFDEDNNPVGVEKEKRICTKVFQWNLLAEL